MRQRKGTSEYLRRKTVKGNEGQNNESPAALKVTKTATLRGDSLKQGLITKKFPFWE